MAKKLLFLGLVAIGLAWNSTAVAQWVPVAQKKGFGQALGADGETLFAADPENIYTPGRVFVYERSGEGAWSQKALLEARDGEIGDGFGAALDAEDGTLVVGAPSANAVYLFRRSGETEDWVQVNRIVPTDSTSKFGTAVEIADQRLFVSASLPDTLKKESEGRDASINAVYVFRRQSSDSWTEEAVLQNDEIAPEGRFGATLLSGDESFLVGAPRHEGGAVVFYRRGPSGWSRTQTLTVGALNEGARFGASLERAGKRILVGAPRAFNTTGATYSLSAKKGTWKVEGRLLPFDGRSNDYFGAALSYGDGELWVGAPGVNRETGALYRFRQREGAWTAAQRISSPSPEQGNSFGSTLLRRGSTVAVGLPGDKYGAGSMALYSTSTGAWTANSPFSPSAGSVFSAMTGEDRPCSGGEVRDFSCKNVDLKAFLPIAEVGGTGGVELNDVWGWTDLKTETEYALVGRADGTAFVDVSNPNNPVYVGELLRTEGSRVNSWRDIKVYKDYAFIVADNVGDHGMQIFDLTQLREVDRSEMPVTFEATALYDRINSAHNVAINTETGYAYLVGGSGGGKTCGGGLHMVNIQDPLNPTFEGCFGGERGAGSGGTGATHDAQCVVYEGPDREYRGREICIGFNETEIAVVDVTDKATPKLLSTASYPNFGYVHQGWFTEDQRYMYSNDEGDELQGNVERTRTIVWDMTDLDNPTVANQLFLSTKSSDHNLYVKGDRMYQSNYKSGLRVFDISNPEEPKEVGHFDIFPPNSTPGFRGTWSNYPYFESGIIVTSTFGGGLFVLEYSEPEL